MENNLNSNDCIENERKQERYMLMSFTVLFVLFLSYVSITIYNEKPAKCYKNDTCNAAFR